MKSINSPRQGSFFWRNSSSVSHPPPTRTMTVLRRIRTKRSFCESPNCKRCTKRSIRYFDILSDILCSGSLLNGYTFHGQNIGSETNSARYKSVSTHREVLSTHTHTERNRQRKKREIVTLLLLWTREALVRTKSSIKHDIVSLKDSKSG